MALDRQSIEKRDFPIGRRGYEPEAVDAHLRSLAEQVSQLERSSRRLTETLASAASEQVRTIVEAAESSAAQIEQQASEEARIARDDADRAARETREQAVQQAQDHVAGVQQATTTMLQRVDAMESELGALIESLRTGTNRLNADLALLKGNMGEVQSAAIGRSESPVADAPEPQPAFADDEAPAAETVEPDLNLDLDLDLDEPIADEPAASASDVDEGARLIALNMALNGSPREEVDAYLSENFALSDREGLLDEVYASVG